MSDKEPFILRNSKAHEVAYSEVTGKITRKVNRIKDDPEPKAENPDQKISTEAGQARAPELVKVATAGQPAKPTVQTAQAGKTAGPSISKAAAGAGDANVLHAKPADTAGAPLAMPPSQKQVAAPEVTTAASAGNAEGSNNVAPSAGIAEANVVHPEDAPIKAEAVAAAANHPATDSNESMSIDTGVADDANVLRPETADSAAETLVTPPAPTHTEDTTLTADTGNTQAANIVQPVAESDEANLVHPDIAPAMPEAVVAVDGNQSTASNELKVPNASVAEEPNIVLPETADTAAQTLLVAPPPEAAEDTVLMAAADTVKPPNMVQPEAAINEANVVRPEAAPAQAEAAVVVAEDHRKGTNTLAIAQSEAPPEKLQGPAQNAAVAHKEVAASAPAAANIMRPGQSVAKEDVPVALPTPRSATANVVEEALRHENPKRVYAEPVASALEPKTMVSPMPGADSVVSDKKSVDEAVAPVAPTVVAQTVHPAAAPQAQATEEKATASITMKISAKVENHLHTVQAETARISQQLERLNTKFAAMEKAHKK